MLRLLGILSLGNLLFGGHHRRAIRRGLLLGALFGVLAHNDFDMERVEKNVRKTAKDVRKTVHHAMREAKKEIRSARKAAADQRVSDRVREIHAERDARREARAQRTAEHLKAVHAEIEARKAERAQRTVEHLKAVRAEIEARKAERENRKAGKAIQVSRTECAEAANNRDLVADLERKARTAAMMRDVPTIQFPEDDPKYNSSRKYGYA